MTSRRALEELLESVEEHRVRHPLVEAGLGKPRIRALARELRLPSAEKPAMPCLASRLPFGTEVRPEILAKVDRAEQALKAIGYRELRVRHLGDRARVELGTDDLERADAEAIFAAVQKAGYLEVAIAADRSARGRCTDWVDRGRSERSEQTGATAAFMTHDRAIPAALLRLVQRGIRLARWAPEPYLRRRFHGQRESALDCSGVERHVQTHDRPGGR